MSVAQHLIPVDEEALDAARDVLGTTTVTDTVNEALRRTAADRAGKVRDALDELAKLDLSDLDDAWR